MTVERIDPSPEVTETSVSSSHKMLPERDLGNYRVPLQEWRRLKKAVNDIREKEDWLRVAGFGFLFLAPAFFVAAFLWSPAFDELSSAAQVKYAAVGTTLIIAGVACLLVALAFFVADWRSSDAEKMGKQHAIDLIENIEDRFLSPGGE